MGNIKKTLQTAKSKISTELKKKIIPVVIFVSGLMLVSCGGKNKSNLTYKDFSGKALKERTLDELQYAKYNMEHGYEIKASKNPLIVEGSYIKVGELGWKSESESFVHGNRYYLPNYEDYIILLDLIHNEIKSRSDTIITKEEYFKLKNNQR